MEEQVKENKMGTMPMKKLVFTMSIPMMVSMLVQALYNIVDSVFVAQIGEKALNAVSLAFPIQILMIAVAVGTGVGINSLIARKLGEKKKEEADATAMNGIFLSIISWIVFAIFGLFFSKLFFRAFTQDAEIIQMGASYISICTIFSFGIFVQIAMEKIMQGTGKAIYTMIVQGIGAIINIILDPIFIFGLFGMPKMGVAGAAIATVIGQIVGMLVGIWLNKVKNEEIEIHFRTFRPNKVIIKEIYAVGIPTMIMESITAILTIGMNKILGIFSETAVTFWGIYLKMQSFIFMPAFGLNNGLIPIIGYNYGAENKERIKKAIKIGLIACVSIMAVGLIIFMAVPNLILMLFNASDVMSSIGMPALRIISLSFLFAGVTIVLVGFFQAIGNGIFSLIISLIRQLVLILPIVYGLGAIFGLQAVWFAFPIAEVIAMVATVAMFQYAYRKYIQKLGEKIEEKESIEA